MDTSQNSLAGRDKPFLADFLNGCCLPAEFIESTAVVNGSGGGNRLRPVGVVEAVGGKLGFQGNAGIFAVVDAALSGGVQEVAGIELDAGAVRGDCQGPAGFRVRQNGAGVGVDLKIVIVPVLQMERFVVGVEVLPDWFGAAEIHGGSIYSALLPCGDVLSVVGVKVAAGQGQHLVHGGFRMVVACQVKVGVVCHVEHRILVAGGVVDNFQTVGLEGVSHPDSCLTGETLVAVGAD